MRSATHVIRRIISRVRRFRSLADRIVRSSYLPFNAKASLLAMMPPLALRLPLPMDVRLRGGPVFVGKRSAYVDVRTVLDVWNVEMFPAEWRGRIVLDIGAHKGYFGAWALSQGAALVVSCEPESSNFGLLHGSWQANDRRDAWRLENVALGARAGTAFAVHLGLSHGRTRSTRR